ncbi:MAG: lysylphosphatidylglycerol synthase transmembrane domain-containing protein [bacterium]
MTKRRWWVLQLLISAAVLGIIFTKIPLSDVVQAMASAHLGFVALGLAASLVIIVLDAIQMKLLTDRQEMSLMLWQIIEVNMTTKFYGLFLPGHLSAGMVRWYRLAKAEQKWTEILAAIVFNRFISTSILVVLGLVCWSLDRPTGTGFTVGLILLAILAGLLLIHVALSSERLAVGSWGRLNVLPSRWVPDPVREKVGRFVSTTVERYQMLQGAVTRLALLALAGHLLGIMMFMCVAIALRIDLSFVQVGWIRCVVGILVMLPISFSGLGVREVTLVLLLSPYGVPQSDALALSFLLFACAMLLRALGGLVEIKYVLSPARRATPPPSPRD